MKYSPSRSSLLFKGGEFLPRPSTQAPAAIACLFCLSLLVAACGGSSGSGAVSDSQLAAPEDNNPASAPPASSEPGTTLPESGDAVAYDLGNTPQAVIDLCMSDADKEMLTQVNNARSRARNCGTRNFPATDPLRWHCTLETVAYEHSRDMGENNFFSHTGSDGLGVANRVTNAGYAWSAIGENIAAGQQTIDAVMSAWLGSAGHCANIMGSSYTEFGAASYLANGSDYPVYWTQVFARPQF